MWNFILLLYVSVIVWGFKINFTERKFIVPKIMNLIIMLTFLYFLANNEIFTLTSFVYNIKSIMTKEYVTVGIISSEISLIIFILNLIIALILSISIVGIIGLKGKYRIIFIKTLPFYLLINLLETYKFFIRQQESEHYKYFGIGLILITGLIIILYSSRFLRKIFISNNNQINEV